MQTEYFTRIDRRLPLRPMQNPDREGDIRPIAAHRVIANGLVEDIDLIARWSFDLWHDPVCDFSEISINRLARETPRRGPIPVMQMRTVQHQIEPDLQWGPLLNWHLLRQDFPTDAVELDDSLEAFDGWHRRD